MKKTNLQFHATSNDIKKFIKSVSGNFFVYGIILSPSFSIRDINPIIESMDLFEYEMIIVSKSEVQHSTEYRDFITKQDNKLGLTIGKETCDQLFESTFWIYSDNDIDSDWKKILNQFKRALLRGAWVVNPQTGGRKYYKGHMYTRAAKQAYESGKIIRPVCGWNYYELESIES